MKKSFVIHLDSLDILEELTDDQVGKLLRKMKSYHNWNIYKSEDKLVDILFINFKNQFDRDLETYNNVCERNREIAVSRWDKKKSTKSTSRKSGTITSPKNTRNTDNDNDSDSDSDNEKDNKKNFEIFWKTFPNRNSSNKKIAKENYMKSNLTDDEIMYEIKILNRMIEIWDKDPQYIKAFERWIRDITPTTPVLLENLYKSMILYLKQFNWEARWVISKRMKDDFGEDIIKQKRDQYGRDWWIVLKFKDDNGNVKVI